MANANVPTSSPTGRQEYVVPDHLDGARLDKAALALSSNVSRAAMKRAIANGAVRVNGRRRPKGALVAKGELLSIDLAELAVKDEPAVPESGAPLVVRYESSAVLVVDKPAGQPTAPLRPHETGTLANALVGRYPELADVGYSPREPGLVHRLDTDTSGLVIVARSPEVFETLRAALKGERIAKTYQLICAAEGLPTEGTIEFPIASHPKDQRRVYACVHPRDVARYAPRTAKTEYSVDRVHGPWALVSARVSRALRHQIRVHFAAIGHPLAGDVLYGGAEIHALGRHALHASRVVFGGEGGVEAFDVSSEMPGPMAALVKDE
jgi:23S rRNA pseudouridine1911/1915/1917 synthase